MNTPLRDIQNWLNDKFWIDLETAIPVEEGFKILRELIDLGPKGPVELSYDERTVARKLGASV